MMKVSTLVLLLTVMLSSSEAWAAGQCAELKTFLDLALRRGRTVTQAGRFERRINVLSTSEQVRVRNSAGNYVEAQVVRYDDGELIYKIGDGPEVPYSLEGKTFDEFNQFLRIADEIPPEPAPRVVAEAPVAPSFAGGSVDGSVTGTFTDVSEVAVDPANVSFGRMDIPEQPNAGIVSNPDNLPAVIPPRPGTAVEVVTTPPGSLTPPAASTDLVPARPLELTRVERPDVPSGLPQLEGPPARPLIEGPPARPLLEAPPERLALPGPDDGLRGGPAPRYAPDVVRPTRASFPESIVDEVITFTSPAGTNVTTGQVVRVNDASVVVRLEDGTEIRKPFVDIAADSIQTIRPRPAAFVARATRANFPDSSVGDVVTFTTPAGQRTSTGRVVRVNDQSVVIELADGSLINERFRNISAASVEPKRPIPAAFVERPTRLDFPDTLIGRSVTFTTPGGRNSTTGIVQGPINGESVNVLLPDGTIVNRRFRDMSRASVRETPVPAVITPGDRAVAVAGDGADAVNEIALTRGVEIRAPGTAVEPRVLEGEVLPPRRDVVPSAERPALEGRIIDAEYTVIDETATALSTAGRNYDAVVRAIPSPAESMPPQGFIDSFDSMNVRFTVNGDQYYGRFTRVDGENVVFTNFDGTTSSIRAADIRPAELDVATLEPFKRADTELIFRRGDEPFNGPYGARNMDGEEIADDVVLRMLTSGSRLVRRAGEFLEFVTRTGQRFKVPLRRLVDSGVTMASKAGDLRVNLNRMNMLGRSLHRVGDLGPFRLDEEETPPGGDREESAPPPPGDDEPPAPAAEEGTPTGGDEESPGDFNTNAPGSDDGGEDDGGETEREVPVPIPPAPRGNPIRPNSAPMQKLNIIRTRGVL